MKHPAASAEGVKEALDRWRDFRVACRGHHNWTTPSVYDPEQRAIGEALAWTGGIRIETEVENAVRRDGQIMRQLYAELCRELPATAIVQATDCDGPGPLRLSAARQFTVVDPQQRQASFRTISSFEVHPVRLRSLKYTGEKLDGDAPHFHLEFAAATSGTFEEAYSTGGRLCVHVDHLQDVGASLARWLGLKNNLKSATLVDSKGQRFPVTLTFGNGQAALGEAKLVRGDLTRARSGLAFPQQALLFHIELPETKIMWEGAQLELELERAWPREINLLATDLHLNSMTVENLWRAPATALRQDGTQRKHALRPSKPSSRIKKPRLQAVCSVHRVRKGGQRELLMPALLASLPADYDLDLDHPLGPRIELHTPQSFGSEGDLFEIEAEWSDPDLSSGEAIAVLPISPLAQSANWQLVGRVMKAKPGVAATADSWVQMSTLREVGEVRPNHVQSLMRAIGIDFAGFWGPCALRLEEIWAKHFELDSPERKHPSPVPAVVSSQSRRFGAIEQARDAAFVGHMQLLVSAMWPATSIPWLMQTEASR